MRRALAVMARTPRLHHTKTRLVPALGAQGALQAHTRLVEDMLRRLHPLVGVDRSLWVTHEDQTVARWAELGECSLSRQPEGDLGARMQGIFEQLLVGGAQAACVVGADVPSINAEFVTRAFTHLLHADVVLAPAEDGGYGLIGMKSPWPALFEGVEWGSAEVLHQTLTAARRVDLRVHLLPCVWDVDEPADWYRYLAMMAE